MSRAALITAFLAACDPEPSTRSFSLSPPVTPLEVGTVTHGEITSAHQIDWYQLPPGIFTVYVDTTACGCADVELRVAHQGLPDVTVVPRAGNDVNLFAVVVGGPDHPPLIAVKQRANLGCYDLAVNSLHQTWNLRVEFQNVLWNASDRAHGARIYLGTAQHMLTATDGGAMLSGASFYPECPTCDSDVVMMNGFDTSYSLPGLSVKLYRGDKGAGVDTDAGRAKVLMHELGHHFWLLPDEYGPPGYWCPPSLMNNLTSSEFCWDGNHQATGYQSAWRDIVLDWAFDKWKATNAPQSIEYRGIANRIRETYGCQGAAECNTATLIAVPQAGKTTDSDGDGVIDCKAIDSDGDGSFDFGDCDPTDPTIFAGVDRDHDGEVRLGCGGEDCDDANAAIGSTKPEVCNGVDDDCDGQIDEGQPDSDSDGVADCFDANDDHDCVADVADNCPRTDNCASAQAILDDPIRRAAITCSDPCAPLPLGHSLEDFAKCIFGQKAIEPRCMIDGCPLRDFGVDIPNDVLIRAGLGVRMDSAGERSVVIPPGFSYPGTATCHLLLSGMNTALIRAQEAKCRAAERARPEYAACQADSNGNNTGDACE